MFGRKKTAAKKADAGAVERISNRLSVAAKIVRVVSLTVRLTVIWVELWGPPAVLAVVTSSHPGGVVTWFTTAIVLAVTARSWKRGALWKNVNDTAALYYRSGGHWRDVCDACELVGVRGTDRKYPKVQTTVGPLKAPGQVVATLVRSKARGGGFRRAFQPMSLEHLVTPLSHQWDERFRVKLESAAKVHYDFGGAKADPVGNKWLLHLSQDQMLYRQDVVDDDHGDVWDTVEQEAAA
jgi:hypothetical protein